ncbi:MAG: hypothetical protein VX777_08645 [Chlamydiota bacterium]|nr:hypothetical protein [Chlamydiota bacterium]
MILFSSEVAADKCCRKLDIGPTAMRVELLECGKRSKKMDMYGVRADGCYVTSFGLNVKPTLLMGWGEGDLYALSLAMGWCVPVGESLIFTPNVGYSWSYLETTIDIPLLQLKDVENKFRATAPLAGLDVIWNFLPCWRVYGSLQYGWSRSWTKIKDISTCHLNTKGPNYGLMLERDLNRKLSANIAFGYNRALSKERHGLKAKGIKLGLVYWF